MRMRSREVVGSSPGSGAVWPSPWLRQGGAAPNPTPFSRLTKTEMLDAAVAAKNWGPGPQLQFKSQKKCL